MILSHLFLMKSNMEVLVAYRCVDFRVLAVLLLQLLHSLLLFLPLLLVQTLQVLPPLVLFQHLVALELLVSLGVVVLQVFGGLEGQDKSCHVKFFDAFHRKMRNKIKPQYQISQSDLC